MAYLVVNSKYNPFSYDELVKPLVDYTNEYNRQEELANALSERAASLGDLSPDIDKEAYDSYNNWREELGAASEQLSTNGLSPETRQRIRQLNSQYSTTLSPLVDKMKTRNELVKEQRALQAKNPNIIFDTDYSTASLSDISSASTYNVYDPDSITKAVGEDVYSRMSNGEAVPSMDEYLARYGAGLNDENKLARVNQAINSGVALGSSTYKQKDFENYIKKIQATRSYSGSGSSGSASTPQQGALSVQAYDHHSIVPTYNKVTKQYQIKNKNNQDVVLPENYNAEDVLKAYYGGDYGYVNALGTTIPRVRTTETDGNGNTREVYSILGPKGWMTLNDGADTTPRQLYLALYGKPLATLSPEDRGLNEDVVNKKLNEKKDKNKWFARDENYHDYATSALDEELVNKLDILSSLGVVINFTVYRDKGDKFVGYRIGTSNMKALDEPIEPRTRQTSSTPSTTATANTQAQQDTTGTADPFRR